MKHLKSIIVHILLFITQIQQISCSEKAGSLATFSEFQFKDREEWSNACKKLVKNISVERSRNNKSAFMFNDNIKSDKEAAWIEFDTALTQAFNLFTSGKLAEEISWLKKVHVPRLPGPLFYNTSQNTFIPYIQKVDLMPEDKVVFHGDFHGDIYSLIKELDTLEEQGYLIPHSFQLSNKQTYLVFLGDYTDRGIYGSEVIYTLLRLKLANPQNVIMVRGNHEDEYLNKICGFKEEIVSKFCNITENKNNKIQKIYRLYDFLPIAAYVGLGDNYLQCCHGGLEPGYNPQPLLQSNAHFDLLGRLNRSCCTGHLAKYRDIYTISWCSQTQSSKIFIPSAPSYNGDTIGFMWADFTKEGYRSEWNPERSLSASESLTTKILAYQNKNSSKKVRGIVRAHQHNSVKNSAEQMNIMTELIESNGVYKHWRPIETDEYRSLEDGLVWTFNVSPDSVYGSGCCYNFDTYGILSVKPKYKDWLLQVCNTQIHKFLGWSLPNKKTTHKAKGIKEKKVDKEKHDLDIMIDILAESIPPFALPEKPAVPAIKENRAPKESNCSDCFKYLFCKSCASVKTRRDTKDLADDSIDDNIFTKMNPDHVELPHLQGDDS